MRSGGHRVGDIVLHGADRMAETLERFCEQSADHCVIFDNQSAQRLQRITSPAPPSFNQTATFSSDIDPIAPAPDRGATVLPGLPFSDCAEAGGAISDQVG